MHFVNRWMFLTNSLYRLRIAKQIVLKIQIRYILILFLYVYY